MRFFRLALLLVLLFGSIFKSSALNGYYYTAAITPGVACPAMTLNSLDSYHGFCSGITLYIARRIPVGVAPNYGFTWASQCGSIEFLNESGLPAGVSDGNGGMTFTSSPDQVWDCGGDVFAYVRVRLNGSGPCFLYCNFGESSPQGVTTLVNNTDVSQLMVERSRSYCSTQKSFWFTISPTTPDPLSYRWTWEILNSTQNVVYSGNSGVQPLNALSYTFNTTQPDNFSGYLRVTLQTFDLCGNPQYDDVVTHTLSPISNDQIVLDPYHQALVVQNPEEGRNYMWFSTADNMHSKASGWAFEWKETGSYYVKSFVVGGRGCDRTSNQLAVTALSHSFNKDVRITMGELKSALPVGNVQHQNRVENITYTDNLGNPLQSISVQASPSLRDIIQPYKYDEKGQIHSNFLPASPGQNSGNYIPNFVGEEDGDYSSSPHLNFYQNTPNVVSTWRPYNSKVWDNGPMPKWSYSDPFGDAYEGMGVQESRRRILSGDPVFNRLKLWTCVSGATSATFRNPENGEVTAVEVIRPSGNKTVSYSDDQGRVWLSEIYEYDGNIGDYVLRSSATSIYDQLNRVVLGVTPKGYFLLDNINQVSFNSNNGVTSPAQLKDLSTLSIYDSKGRLKKRYYPDEGWEYYLYNITGQAVMTSPPQLNGTTWHYSISDELGRIAVKGTAKLFTPGSKTQEELQAALDNPDLFYYAILDDDSGFPIIPAFAYLTPLGALGLQESPTSFYYYDGYDIDRNGTADYAYDNQDEATLNEYGTLLPRIEFPTGLPTVVKTKISDDNGGVWSTSVRFYDINQKLIQQTTYDPFFGNNAMPEVNRSSFLYDFSGKLVVSKTTISGPSTWLSSNISRLEKFGYDRQGRLITSDLKLDSDPWIRVVSNEYNSLGQLYRRFLPAAEPFKFHYDENGRLTAINDPYEFTTSPSQDDPGKNDQAFSKLKFAERIFYGTQDNQRAKFYNNPNYDGKISSIVWGSRYSRQRDKLYDEPLDDYVVWRPRIYNYSYDALGRLTTADYVTKAGPSFDETWFQNGDVPSRTDQGESFALRSVEYDPNGNITRLLQDGAIKSLPPNNWGIIDDIHYTYGSSNKPTLIEDVSPVTQGHPRVFDFAHKSELRQAEDAYDANGYATGNSSNGQHVEQITYEKITGGTSSVSVNVPSNGLMVGGNLDFVYDKTGTLLSRTANINSTRDALTEYHNGYRREVRRPYPTAREWIVLSLPYGRAYRHPNETTWRYEAHAYDHQGSLRAAWGYHPVTSTGCPPGQTCDEKLAAISSMRMTSKEVATMEVANSVREDTVFENLRAVRQIDALYARTGTGVGRVSASDGKPMGPLKYFSVKSGDSISVEAPVFWSQSSSGNVFTTLGAYIASVLSGQVISPGENAIFTNPVIQLAVAATPQAILASTAPGKPKAYLRYVRFSGKDSSIVFDTLIQVDSKSKDDWYTLGVADRVTQDGYVVTYLASEGGAPVYSDDFSVTTYTQDWQLERHYYPFGLAMGEPDFDETEQPWYSGVERAPGLPGFTGQEEQENEWWAWAAINFGARAYDYQLARWHAPDPARQMDSPYDYCGGDPVGAIDPDGQWALIDDAIAIGVGALTNVIFNAGSIGSAGQFFSYLAVGAAAGEAGLYGGPVAAGAVLGLGNSLTQQISANGLSGVTLSSTMTSTLMGVATGWAGSTLGAAISPLTTQLSGVIGSPIIGGTLAGATGGAITGTLIGGVSSYALGGGFLSGAQNGLVSGLLFGGISGAASSFSWAQANGFNPWTGNRSKSWLAANAPAEPLLPRLSELPTTKVNKELRAEFPGDFYEALHFYNDLRAKYGLNKVYFKQSEFPNDNASFRAVVNGRQVTGKMYPGGGINPEGWTIKEIWMRGNIGGFPRPSDYILRIVKPHGPK